MARGGGRGGSGGGFGGTRGGGSSFGGSRGGGSRLGGGTSRGRGGLGGSRPTGNYNRPRPRGGYYGGIPPFLGGYGLGRGSRRRRPYNRGGCSGCGGGGCLSSVLTIFLLLIAFNFLWGMIPGNNNNTAVQTVQVPSSTIEREAIEPGLVNETAYYEDKLDWIRNPNELKKGLSYFYDKTNIQPFVYITDNINGDPNPRPEEIDAYANQLYDELFTDEAHLLLLHFENNQYQYEYSYHTVYGSQAKVLMDDEAEGILFDYLDYHYARDPNKVSEEQFFSEAFQDTADRIMTVTRSPWIPVLLVIGVATILIVLFNWWRSLLNKNKEKDKEVQNPVPKMDKKENDLDDFDF